MPVGYFGMVGRGQARVHFIVPILGTLLSGMGFVAIFTPVQSHFIDAFPKYLASGIAANTVTISGEPVKRRKEKPRRSTLSDDSKFESIASSYPDGPTSETTDPQSTSSCDSQHLLDILEASLAASRPTSPTPSDS